jgi:hypothetical protein
MVAKPTARQGHTATIKAGLYTALRMINEFALQIMVLWQLATLTSGAVAENGEAMSSSTRGVLSNHLIPSGWDGLKCCPYETAVCYNDQQCCGSNCCGPEYVSSLFSLI